MLEPFIDRLAAVAVDGREVLVVYVNPQHAHLLEDPRRFEPIFADAYLRVYRWRTGTSVAASPG